MAELETQIEIAKRLKFAPVEMIKNVESSLSKIIKMLNIIIKKLSH